MQNPAHSSWPRRSFECWLRSLTALLQVAPGHWLAPRLTADLPPAARLPSAFDLRPPDSPLTEFCRRRAPALHPRPTAAGGHPRTPRRRRSFLGPRRAGLAERSSQSNWWLGWTRTSERRAGYSAFGSPPVEVWPLGSTPAQSECSGNAPRSLIFARQGERLPFPARRGRSCEIVSAGGGCVAPRTLRGGAAPPPTSSA